MQHYALTVDKFLDHAAKWYSGIGVVEAVSGKPSRKQSYADLRERSNQLSGALTTLGLQFGDRIGTLAWNTQGHLEIYYAAMGIGLVCHTLNPRLTPAHLTAMINAADDRVLAVAADLLPIVRGVLPGCPQIQHIIVLDHAPADLDGFNDVTIWTLDALLAQHGAPAVWGGFDENSPAGLCFTSGTTGAPKGVVYTHRSNYLHTMNIMQADVFGLTSADVVLAAVPMFHANGWGLPFAAPAAGTRLVLPGPALDGASLARLMRDEAVTVAVGVPTVWIGVVDHLEATGDSLPALKRVLIGGSSCPEALISRIEDKLGVYVQTSWGMTELSPLGAVAPAGGAPLATRASGRPPVGVDLKLTDADGQTLNPQRSVVGHLKVRGASVIDRYYQGADNVLDAEGYFDTGDLASIDDHGYLTIRGRSKDLIKSGGEWINPGEMEAIIGRDPRIRHIAIIGRADAKWGERPVLVVEWETGPADPRDLIELLRGQVADWWLPSEAIAVSAMPLAVSGKIDKLALRANYAAGV